jgi:hypothetical protein
MGHLATRARIAGFISLCLLLSSLGATGVLASAAPPQTTAPQAAAIVVGTGSCVGTDACLNAVGPIGNNSCIGDYSCKDTAGSIGSDSCVGIGYPGPGGSCTGVTGNIGAGSCNGSQTCGLAIGNIVASVGNNSCNGDSACLGKAGTVGDDSCDGNAACTFSTGNIGDGSCTGNSVCYSVSGTIGNDSCNGDSACGNATSNNIGNNSCNGADSCVVATASIGNNSCNGVGACDRKSTAVGDCANNLPGSVPAACVDPQPDARIRRIGTHKMVGTGIYNTDGTNQTLTDTLGERRVRFVISIQNASAVADSFTIGASTGVLLIPGPAVRFYHGWPAQDISAAVWTSSYTTPTIAPGGVYRIRAAVLPSQITLNHLAAGPGVPHYSWLVTATSVGNPTKADAVRFAVDVPSN